MAIDLSSTMVRAPSIAAVRGLRGFVHCGAWCSASPSVLGIDLSSMVVQPLLFLGGARRSGTWKNWGDLKRRLALLGLWQAAPWHPPFPLWRIWERCDAGPPALGQSVLH